MPEEKKSSTMTVSAIVILVLAVASYGLYKYVKKESTSGVPVVPPPPSELVGPPVSTSIYKDGSYNSIGEYNSPGGSEQIDVTLVLKDDAITNVTVKSLAVRPISKKMQSAFISGVNTAVVGKKLTEVTLTKVSGSSLTPKGWNDAITKIQVQAKA